VLRWLPIENLFVEIRRLLQLGVADDVVLDPELCAGFFEEDLHGGPRLSSLLGVEFVDRQPSFSRKTDLDRSETLTSLSS
jgi:hypothetical protein